MTLRILESAMIDLCAARLFYERQGAGLGAYFFDSVFADIDSLVHSAGIHPVFLRYHRLLAKRFPYAVYYTVKDDSVCVWRVLDERRDPRRNRRALRNPSA
ncbi:MAG: type II toxin-antitoxin system RelE/ParE family toxin [Verrucomicrobiota bacterium]|nr:type II toxin-antitoxin system RelE/ParE family toxin [Verrucomicrobiota bacterium]